MEVVTLVRLRYLVSFRLQVKESIAQFIFLPLKITTDDPYSLLGRTSTRAELDPRNLCLSSLFELTLQLPILPIEPSELAFQPSKSMVRYFLKLIAPSLRPRFDFAHMLPVCPALARPQDDLIEQIGGHDTFLLNKSKLISIYSS